MLRKQALLGCISQRHPRPITTYSPTSSVTASAGATSINIPWITTPGSITANVRNYMVVALKPGTANLGAISTPSGWTLVDSHIGGGYGATLGTDTGNTRVALFIRDNDNTTSGSVTVSITPDGASGVASGNMGRIEKTAGSWQTIVTTKGEATVDTTAGSYALNTPMFVSRGDVLIYGFGLGYAIVGGSVLSAGPGLVICAPPLVIDAANSNGNHETMVSTGRRATNGIQLGTQTLTVVSPAVSRGPMVVARMRVR